MYTNSKKIVIDLLNTADITINGNKPTDIQIHNEAFYHKVLTQGSLGMGESYMDGWWDSGSVDEMIAKILAVDIEKKIIKNWSTLLYICKTKLLNRQSIKKAFTNGQKHYDLGNDLFQNMLDKRMNYSCGYWKDATNLEEAQEKKLDLICKKLQLSPGMKVLDIGCGWGAFGKFAAEKYQVKVTGITVSPAQIELGQKLCLGLPVTFLLMDYRNLNEKFDRVVSVGMIEHVGYKNYSDYFETANRCLVDDGLFLLHTIGSSKTVTSLNPWMNKYIFPNAQLPSLVQLTRACEPYFIIEDVHNFGKYYDDTLMAWYGNFKNNWQKIASNYSPPFYRMWEYYLLSNAASFRVRQSQLWQLVLSKKGVLQGYNSCR